MRVKRPLFLASIILTPLLIGVAGPRLVDSLRTLAISVSRPVLELQSQAAHFFTTEIKRLIELPRLRGELEELKTQAENFSQERSNFEEIKQENKRLESLLQLKTRLGGRGVAARVIGRDPSHWSQFIVINKGKRDGVRKNTVLVHPEGLVGKVVAAGKRSARAILLVDAESRASAMNQRTRDVGLIQGTGSPMLKMVYLDRTSDLQVGDIVVSSGLGGIYPKGIPIGKVELVGGEKDRLKLYAVVRPFVPFAKLEEVLCVPSQVKD
ncbi:MAG: rod shape-determining protein MreC [Candidatus Omnitrophica bacterium]|nr:rod shape-determining protein MreC [Candidatus Omnitrophota bacterium]